MLWTLHNGRHWATAPCVPPGSPPSGEGDAFLFGSSGPAAVAGYPSTTVPAGYSGELPVGLRFFGARWDDARIMSLAYSFEQATDVRRPPELLPTLD